MVDPVVVKPSRPRPRPAYHGAISNPPPIPSSSSLNPILPHDPQYDTLAERAKLRQRARKPPTNLSGLLSSDDELTIVPARAPRLGHMAPPDTPRTVPVASSEAPLMSSLPPSDPPFTSTAAVVPESPAKPLSKRKRQLADLLSDDEDTHIPALAQELEPNEPPLFFASSSLPPPIPDGLFPMDDEQVSSVLRPPSPSIQELIPPTPQPIVRATKDKNKSPRPVKEASESKSDRKKDRKTTGTQPSARDTSDGMRVEVEEGEGLPPLRKHKSKTAPAKAVAVTHMVITSDDDEILLVPPSKSTPVSEPSGSVALASKPQTMSPAAVDTRHDEVDELDLLSSSSRKRARRKVVSDDEEYDASPGKRTKKTNPKAKKTKDTLKAPSTKSTKETMTSSKAFSEVYVEIPRQKEARHSMKVAPGSVKEAIKSSSSSDLSDAPDSEAEEELLAPKTKAPKTKTQRGVSPPAQDAPSSAPVPKKGRNKIVDDTSSTAMVDSTGSASSTPTVTESLKATARPNKGGKRGKVKTLIDSDEDDESPRPGTPQKKRVLNTPLSPRNANIPDPDETLNEDDPSTSATKPNPSTPARAPNTSSLVRSVSSSARRRAAPTPTPMQALINRVNSLPSSPFPTPSSATPRRFLSKNSRSALSRIAPLHATRRTPPPPPPPPPKPKKTKKQLEREEKWEEELAEIDGWAAMSNEERAALRRAKWEAELGVD